MMPVYFVQAGEDGPVKIGFAGNVARRITVLQIGCPEPLRLLGVIAGSIDTESHFHQQFSSKRLAGEWFGLSRDDIGPLGLTAIPFRSQRVSSVSPQWDEIERLGRELGVGEEAIRKWRVRGVPKAWRLDLIDADKGGKIDRAAFDSPPGSRRSNTLPIEPEQTEAA